MFFEAKCVKLLRSKGFLLSKVFFEAKCASASEEAGQCNFDSNAKGGEVRTGSPSFFEGGNGVEATSSEKVD